MGETSSSRYIGYRVSSSTWHRENMQTKRKNKFTKYVANFQNKKYFNNILKGTLIAKIICI